VVKKKLFQPHTLYSASGLGIQYIKDEAGGNFRRDGNIIFECPSEEIKGTHEQLQPQQPITGPGFEPANTDIRITVVTTLINCSHILSEQAISCIIKTTLKKSIRF